MARKIREEVLSWIMSGTKSYVMFIWNTPSHMARWGAVALAAPILVIGLRYLPGFPDSAATQFAGILLLCLSFYALAATLLGGRGS